MMTLPGHVMMMRRHDVIATPYYVTTPHTRIVPPPEDGVAKPKKSWGERLKLGSNKTKEEHQIRDHNHVNNNNINNNSNNYLLHEYRNKYGTLSSGSALSKSMKYAETWLYGTDAVGTVPPAPRHHFPATLIPHVSMCACKDFIGGTVRSKKNASSTGMCKKCGGSRMPWNGGGTLRAATVRVNDPNRMGGTVRVGQSKVRPSLMNVSQGGKMFTPDPYDLMRRNRMGAQVEEDAPRRPRAKSSSPGRRQGRSSPSPVRRPRREVAWGMDEPTVDKRKSILECDVNPYQLIAKYLNGEDAGEEVLEDELSDGMEDNALETEKVIGGQRIKVYHSTQDADYVQDEPEVREEASPQPKVSLIPRLQSPKRPKRRVKSLDGRNAKPDETESPIERRNINNYLPTSIKSILKKPTSGSVPAAVETASSPAVCTFSDTVPRQESIGRQSLEEVPRASKSEFHLPTFQQYKRDNLQRKKKQVQFDVDPGCATTVSGVESCATGTGDENVIQVTVKVVPTEESAGEAVGKTVRYFGDSWDDVEAAGGVEKSTVVVMPPTVAHVWRDKQMELASGPVVTLRRSLSDRHVDPDVSLKTEQTAALFNDTMRLRLLSGRRTDSRQAFSHPATSLITSVAVSKSKRLLSPGRSRPKEPPPPPPLPVQSLPQPEAKKAQPVTVPEPEYVKSPAKQLTLVLPPPGESQTVASPPELPVASPEVLLPEVIPTPPQLPPRHIFPFTKKQIQNINNQKRHKSLQSSSVTDQGMVTKTRPNSCIPDFHLPSPEAEPQASRIRHRNSDPGASVNFRPAAMQPEVNRTVVSVCPDSPDVHRLQIKTDAFPPSRRTSILINGDPEPSRVTSVIIDDQQNTNKVTISVGGGGATTWSNINTNNSCTIIDTSNVSNYVSIPVTPEPVYNQRSNIQVDDRSVMIVDRTTGKSLGTQHEYDVLELLMNPVEAVRRHMVPHVCGKVNPDGGANLVSPSAMERLNSLLEDQKAVESDTTAEVESASEVEEKPEVDQENNGISIHYFTAPCFVIGDDEVTTQKDIYDDVENIYESIKDPIYEEIGLPDTPPPLPLSPPPSLDDLDDKRTSRSIFEGASKYDILNYLVDAKERGYVESDYSSLDTKEDAVELSSLGELSSRVSNLSNASDSSEDAKDNLTRKSSAEIERNDSGVGSETSKSSRSRWQSVPVGIIREDQAHLCEDCDQQVETQVTDSGVMYAPLVCRKCAKKRAERKDTIAEIVETEEKYGGDLRIILEEFYRPMLVAGLLTSEQLAAIFLNVEELLENNAALAEKLRDALEIALEQGDEDLLTVNIGSLFLEAAPMLHAFESYCTRQGGASLLLANLEKEKELLRIFLRVSQMENAVLRRMNLNSFLMVPVQRVTKYPLLLARLHKVTPSHHTGRDLLKQAQHKIELHLEHMNSVAKDISTTKLWRRISIVNGRRSSSEIDMINIKLRKMAVDVLEWNHDEVKFAMEGRMLYTNPTDNNWRKGRTIKLNPVNALLVTNGKQTEDYRPEDESLLFPKRTGVREATLLLVKEKCGRYSLLRDPLYLDKCIVCCETDWEDYFEVQELASKDTFIFKAEDSERTKLWYKQLQYHSQGLGAWRRRRNALANIMINGMTRT